MKLLNKTEIAYRYYLRVAPERTYDREQARKQFIQDAGLDGKLLKEIISELAREQKLEVDRALKSRQ